MSDIIRAFLVGGSSFLGLLPDFDVGVPFVDAFAQLMTFLSDNPVSLDIYIAPRHGVLNMMLIAPLIA